MTIALLGNGKTGSAAWRLAQLAGHGVTVFNRSNPVTSDKLAAHDIIISFVPGPVFEQWMPVLLESGIPVVSGSTGFHWPGSRQRFSAGIHEKGLIWLQSGNFSIGCGLIVMLLKQLSTQSGISGYHKKITETHHIHKMDAPSGTAIMWKESIGGDTEIQSVREGEILGIHELELKNGLETISIRHEVTNRAVFAQGAIQAAEFIHRNRPEIRPGLYDLQELMSTYKHLQ